MITPYDWQEGMSHRAGFVEARLQGGTPVVAASVPEGILMVTARRQANKIYEVYDHLMVGMVGQQSDVEALRVAAIDFSHQEGFQRSEQDVTIQRVVNAISNPLKRAFSDFNTSPFVVRALFAEAGPDAEKDSFFVLDYDGDYSLRRGSAYISGSEDTGNAIYEALAPLREATLSLEKARPILEEAWAKGLDPTGAKSFKTLTENLTPEIVLLTRQGTESRFKNLA